ncbi:MAG: hypothetical protein DWQ10_15285, partial [Calditrichaeota bacterium]
SSGEVLETNVSNFGSFRFDLETGSYDLEIFAGESGYKRQTVMIAANEVQNISVSLQQVTTSVGTVFDAETSQPLAGVRIFDVSTNELLTTTDAEGNYQFVAIPNPTYSLSATLSGYDVANATVTASEDGSVITQLFYLQPQAAAIRGRVLHNSSPIAGAKIYIAELNRTVFTDNTGLFEITVSPGNYSLTISAGCLDQQQRFVAVLTSAGVDLEIILTGTASVVQGRVFDQNNVPLSDASILAAGNSTFSSRSDSLGYFTLCLDADSYYLLVSHIGYLTADTTLIVAQNDTLPNVNFHLEDNFATLTGTLTTNDEQPQPVPNIQLIFSNAWQQVVTSSDQSGFFSFDNLYPGQGVLIIRSTNYYAEPQAVELLGKQAKNINITLSRNDAFISGVVIDAKSGSGLSGAQLSAQVIGGSQLFTTQSNTDGSFLFSNMPSITDIRFKISAEKNGYALVQAVDDVAPNTAGVVLNMLAKNAVISGKITDQETQQPVAGVTVTLGSFGRSPDISVQNQADGSFSFSQLVESFEYSISIAHPHFEEKVLNTVAPATGLLVPVQRMYAWAKGKAIFLDSQMAFRNASFIFTNLDGQGRSDTVSTDNAGAFLTRLLTGTYLVRVEAPLYFGTPTNTSLEFLLNDTTDVGTFSLEKQLLDQMQIEGPVEFSNHLGGAQFQLSAFDTLNRSISSIPSIQWFVDIGADTAQIDRSGYLYINSSFIGELQLAALDSLTGLSATKRVEVIAQVDSSTNALFFGRRKQKLSVLPGTFDPGTTIQFASQNLSPVQNVERNFRALNPLVKIIPENVQFNRSAILLLPVPDNPVWGRLGILRWDNLRSTWQIEEDLAFIPADEADGSKSRGISEGGNYALVELSEPLNVMDLQLKPNPFSPLQENSFGEMGIAISFVLTSNRVALPLVTAKIYTLQGDLIAILANQKPTGKGPQHFSWDGRTLDEHRARNGRYILHFRVEDGSDQHEILKSIVLIQ